MSDAAAKIASLLGKLQERLNRLTGTVYEITARIQQDYGRTETKFVQLHSRDESLLARIKEVAFDNDKREEAQVLRDQSNVQSIVDLRELTQKGFDLVGKDIASLVKSVQRLNERMGQLESKTGDICVVDQQEVNAKLLKLTKAYDGLDSLNERLRSLEDEVNPPSKYLGYDVRFRGNQMFVGDSPEGIFNLSGEVASSAVQPYGLVITLKNGDQLILCGGPSPLTMCLNFYKRVS